MIIFGVKKTQHIVGLKKPDFVLEIHVKFSILQLQM